MPRSEIKEWHHQDSLSRQWREHGLVLGGSKLLLCAYEVKWFDWRMNGEKKNPNKGKIVNSDSADFIFCDIEGRIWVFEYKKRLTARVPVLNSLYQVTHCTALYAKTLTYIRLNNAYIDGFSVPQRNLPTAIAEISLAEAHRKHFKLLECIDESVFGSTPFHRVICGGVVGDISKVVSSFLKSDFDTTTQKLHEKHPVKGLGSEADRIWITALEHRADLMSAEVYILDCSDILQKDPPRVWPK